MERRRQGRSHSARLAHRCLIVRRSLQNMPGQPPSTSVPSPADDLHYLAEKGVTDSTLQTCRGLMRMVLDKLRVQGELEPERQAFYLREILVAVSENYKSQAVKRFEDH